MISGKGTTEQRNVVLANAGVCISTFKGIDISEGVALAAESLDSSKAYQSLKNLIEVK